MGVDTIAHGEVLRLSRREQKRKRGLVALIGPYLLAIILFTISIFFYLWTRVSVITLNYEIGSLSAREEALIQENRELKLQLGTIITPENLERIGKNELGLIYPDNSQIVPIR
jgi:cell division protein FtsL